MGNNIVFIHTREDINHYTKKAQKELGEEYEIRTLQNPYNNSKKTGKDFRKNPIAEMDYFVKLINHVRKSRFIQKNKEAPLLLYDMKYAPLIRNAGYQGEIIVFGSVQSEYEPHVNKIEVDIYDATKTLANILKETN